MQLERFSFDNNIFLSQTLSTTTVPSISSVKVSTSLNEHQNKLNIAEYRVFTFAMQKGEQSATVEKHPFMNLKISVAKF